jgi:hypothetical protein
MMMKSRDKDCITVGSFWIERDATRELICTDLSFEEVFEVDIHMEESERFRDISILGDIWINDETPMRSWAIRGIQSISDRILTNKLLT